MRATNKKRGNNQTSTGLPKRRDSERGFTLVEVLVAVGLSTIVLFLVVKMMTDGTWADIRLNIRQETRDATEELKQMAKSPACGINQLLGNSGTTGSNKTIAITADFFEELAAEDTAFVSKRFNEIPLNGASGDGLSSNALNFVMGRMYGKLRISDIRIMPLKIPTATTPDFSYNFINPHKVRAQLYVAFEPQAGAAEGQLQTIRYPVILHLNDDNSAIVNCNSIEELATTIQMCNHFGGEWLEELQSCDIQSNSTTTGQPTTCPVNDNCGVSSQYIL